MSGLWNLGRLEVACEFMSWPSRGNKFGEIRNKRNQSEVTFVNNEEVGTAMRPGSYRVFRFGPFEADVQAGELRRDGAKVSLQDQPFHVLVALLGRPGEIVGVLLGISVREHGRQRGQTHPRGPRPSYGQRGLNSSTSG